MERGGRVDGGASLWKERSEVAWSGRWEEKGSFHTLSNALGGQRKRVKVSKRSCIERHKTAKAKIELLCYLLL